MRRKILFGLLVLSGMAQAATTPEQKLAGLTKGRVAGTPVECIRPEAVVLPEIIDRQAIVYRATGTVYVVRPVGECPALRDGALIQTASQGGLLCRGQQFRLAKPPGPSESGVCAFGSFTPYRKAK